MMPRVRRRMLLAAMMAAALATARAAPITASAPVRAFAFGVIGHPLQHGRDEAALKRAIADVAQTTPAFVVATGIKAATEPCSDKLYAQRRDLLNESAAPMVVSLAGSDWSACLNSAGRSNAIERLNRLREVFYVDSESLGARKLQVTRLSSTAKFRSYAENSHWEYGKVLFATINLPANNNHYRPEAGRNSEFEDRLVANRAWLHRLFTLAERQKMQGLVLFSDGDAGVTAEEGFSLLASFQTKQDGFAEVRKQIRGMAEKYKGKVLLIDAQPVQQGAQGEPAIQWRENVGHVTMTSDWAEVHVTPGAAALFSIKGGSAAATTD
ncbi:hypothetical protein GJ698_21155 [Pseudoduganella sp. FT26W]|uniref:Uncharacterized protein n=1 Tax=Duganella aquatilis TaxID=2666082 RepID=A0A844DF61_9BURK|nr:hypothetical protein [Duganella aquatilis]MRW86584.1 hypothetical protein [Duganella aquatilis]